MGTARQGACKRTLLAGHNRANTSIGRNDHGWRYSSRVAYRLEAGCPLSLAPDRAWACPTKMYQPTIPLLITQRPLIQSPRLLLTISIVAALVILAMDDYAAIPFHLPDKF
jgi:hypothetical protein